MMEIPVMQGEDFFAAAVISGSDGWFWPVYPAVNKETTLNFIQEATGFELLGVTSLTKPKDPFAGRVLSEAEKAREIAERAAKIEPEEYLYALRPIPPPGYTALGLCFSRTLRPQGVVWCVAQEFVGFTEAVAREAGAIYGAQTAAYIHEFTSLLDCTPQERTRRMQGAPAPDMQTVRLVQPRGSPFLHVSTPGQKYPYLLPE